MNSYGFDYLNYINNIPGNINYSKVDNNMMNSYEYMNPVNYVNNFNEKQLYNPSVGLEKGNLFQNLYCPYKNYKAMKLNPSNERDAMMYQLMQYKFGLIELQLYLDVYPEDRQMLELYRKYLSIEKQVCSEYEKKYGSITCDSEFANYNSWGWINNPWPWEVK